MLVGGKKEVETLTLTVQNLTDKLMAAEKAQSEQASALAELKDELEVLLVEKILAVDGTNEEFSDQFSMHFSAIQTSSREGNKVDQKYHSHYLLCNQIYFARLAGEEGGTSSCE